MIMGENRTMATKILRDLTLFVFGFLLIFMLAATNAYAQKRFALVIGNGIYEAGGSLVNAPKDARLIAKSFESVGFETELLIDLDEESMGQALDRLEKIAGSLDVVALYYAGHAIQKDGFNYLIPTDAQLETESAIEREAIALQSYMKVLERVPVSLMFLDACRNNPFTEKIAKNSRATDRAIVVQKGLAVVRPIGDMLITFATLPNSVAFDGDSENSPFARALARQMKTPNVEISVLMKRLTRSVFQETGGKQRPQQLSQMQTEFYFVKTAEAQVTRDDLRSVLSVYPATVSTGEEIALVADVPNDCLPAFFDLAKNNGKVTPIPRKFFKQVVLGNGQLRYEISPGSRYGLVVQEQDARGIHTMGYFCEPSNLERDGKVALLKALKSNFDEDILQGKVEVADIDKTLFHFQQYEIK